MIFPARVTVLDARGRRIFSPLDKKPVRDQALSPRRGLETARIV
jgi:hypothetical protein